MVRNLKGGTGTKALARKHSTSSSNGNIRLPSCPAEQFAFISKMFGHGMCEAFLDNDTRLIAHIRNKFRGRQKRQNTITSSSIVLVGLREWETSPNNCDILFVYDEHNLNHIQTLPNAPHNLLKRIHSDSLINSFTNTSDLLFHDQLYSSQNILSLLSDNPLPSNNSLLSNDI